MLRVSKDTSTVLHCIGLALSFFLMIPAVKTLSPLLLAFAGVFEHLEGLTPEYSIVLVCLGTLTTVWITKVLVELIFLIIGSIKVEEEVKK